MPISASETKLKSYCRREKVDATVLGTIIGRSHPQALRYLKEHDDPLYTIPPKEVMEKIYKWSEGRITPSDFYPVNAWQKSIYDAQACEVAA